MYGFSLVHYLLCLNLAPSGIVNCFNDCALAIIDGVRIERVCVARPSGGIFNSDDNSNLIKVLDRKSDTDDQNYSFL